MESQEYSAVAQSENQDNPPQYQVIHQHQTSKCNASSFDQPSLQHMKTYLLIC